MRITADSLSGFGLVDEILQEPLGAAHRDPAAAAEVLRNALLQSIDRLEQLTPDQ
jgi:acetyl-CoA carboxylase carboxyl transferase subunit alpha